MSTQLDVRDEMRLPGLTGRVALVTGGARGIGAAIAQTLAGLGATAVAADLETPSLPGTAPGVTMDVRDESSIDAAFTTVEARHGSPSIVVANAGIMAQGALVDTPLELWQEIMAVNLTGVFLTFKRAIPAMVEGGRGRVIGISSAAGRNGGQTFPFAAYATSKGGVATMVQSLARELGGTGVTVNCVLPAVIESQMNVGLNGLEQRLLTTRAGRPADVANAVAFLASDAASYMTGELMDVNGGFVID